MLGGAKPSLADPRVHLDGIGNFLSVLLQM
jgi:hypothetical protein